MAMTSGSTKAVEAIMDAAALVRAVEREQAGVLDSLADAGAKLGTMDAALQRTAEWLQAAFEFSDPVDRDAMVARALTEIRRMRKRVLAAGLLEPARAAHGRLIERTESVAEELADLVPAAAGARAGGARFSAGPGDGANDYSPVREWPELAVDRARRPGILKRNLLREFFGRRRRTRVFLPQMEAF